MEAIGLVVVGLVLMAAGVALARRFYGPANMTGIGNFTLLPLAGFAYLLGLLLAVGGGLLVALSMAAGW